MGDFINNLWNDFTAYAESLMLTFMDFMKDFLFFVLEQLMTIAVYAIGSIGDSLSAIAPTQYIDAIPPETKHMLQICGINECMGMIVTTITVKFLLQTIPFVRWGSK